MADQLLSTLPRHDTLPENYIRPESQRPRLSEVITDSNIPVIDLSLPKSTTIPQIANACENYGFFQVVNHGIAEEMLKAMMGIGLEFFKLPPEEKAKLYSDDPAKKMRLSTSFNVKKEKVHNWRDYLRLHCYPLEEFVPDWPSKPELFKEIVSTYCTQVRKLGFVLLGYISESLGLEENYIKEVLGEQEQHMAVNYYPQCPEPELTYGLPSHTDPNALTILLQDQHVTGLQVLKEGKWIAVDPIPWALTINIGDQLQFSPTIIYNAIFPNQKLYLFIPFPLSSATSVATAMATSLSFSRLPASRTEISSSSSLPCFTPPRFSHCLSRGVATRSRSMTVRAMAPPKPSDKPKKVTGIVKLALEAGKATPAPPVGPALGAMGVNIMAFCKEYNAKTAEKSGYIIPVEITVFDDRSFTFILKTPPASVLLKKAAGIEKGSKDPKREKVGKVTKDQVRAIAEEKMPDLNCKSIESAMRMVAGTAANMGIDIEPPILEPKKKVVL